MNSHKCSRENWKRFKNCSCFCQTHVFRDLIKSPHNRQFKLPKHSRTKIWKIFLSVFRDWKVYQRVSCELSRENLWVTLATGPSTREQVTKNDPRRRDWGSRLDIPATEPPKQGKTGFLKIFRFFKQNTFQKHLKHSKIFCAWINKDWACENTFHQVQLHKWIWHLLNIDLCVMCGHQ